MTPTMPEDEDEGPLGADIFNKSIPLEGGGHADAIVPEGIDIEEDEDDEEDDFPSE
jgi:hypothetical protein